MTEPTIVSSHGWHTATVEATSRSTHVVRTWQVRWRTQTHRCHGQIWDAVDGNHLPCYVDGSHGDLRARVSQCGNCGSAKAWRFTAKAES